jgi:hypothetical protein
LALTVAFFLWPSANHPSVQITNKIKGSGASASAVGNSNVQICSPSVRIENTGAGPQQNAIGNSNTQIVNIYQTPTNPTPGLPEIQIGTVDGEPLWGDQVTANPDLKMIRLRVRNTNDVDIFSFRSRLQLPEPVVMSSQHAHTPTGVQMSWRPLRQMFNAFASGVGSNGVPASVTREGNLLSMRTAAAAGSVAGVSGFVDSQPSFDPGEQRSRRFCMVGAVSLTGIWDLALDKLPPGGFVEMYFQVSNGSDATNYISFLRGGRFSAAVRKDEEPYGKPKPDGELLFYWEGEFQFSAGGRLKKQRFFAPLLFDSGQRNLVQIGLQVDKGRWRPVTLDFGF